MPADTFAYGFTNDPANSSGSLPFAQKKQVVQPSNSSVEAAFGLHTKKGWSATKADQPFSLAVLALFIPLPIVKTKN
jgi:hypothetical protein